MAGAELHGGAHQRAAFVLFWDSDVGAKEPWSLRRARANRNKGRAGWGALQSIHHGGAGARAAVRRWRTVFRSRA
jgi:hypothetical protein